MVTAGEAAKTRRDEIKSLIQDNDLTRAIKRLLDYTREFSKDRKYLNEAVAISFQYNRLRENERKRLRSPEDIETELQRIVGSVLESADRLFEEYLNQSQPEALQTEPMVSRHSTPPLLQKQASDAANSPYTALEIARKEHEHKESTLRRTVFECKGLGKRFAGTIDRFELSGVSLAVRPGNVIGVVGVNGAGKTTLLRIIAGELQPTTDCFSYPLLANESLDWPAVRDLISYVQQSPPPWQGRLLDNLYLHASFHGLYGQENISEADFLIQRLGLHKFRDAKWAEISGGYKMRFALAKALITRPKLLILDEPLAPLDIFSQQTFLRDLRDLADSIQNPLPIVLTSQHLYEIEAIADILLFLDGGKPIFCDIPTNIGTGRTSNTYEVAFFPDAAMSSSKLYEIVQNLRDVRVEEHGLQFTLHTSREVPGAEVISLIAACGWRLQYFRDVTSSSRVLFADLQESQS